MIRDIHGPAFRGVEKTESLELRTLLELWFERLEAEMGD